MKRLMLVLTVLGLAVVTGCLFGGSNDENTSGGGGNNGLGGTGGSGGSGAMVKVFNGNQDQEARGIVQASDGGFLITGYTKAKGKGGKDIYVLKLDGKGDQVWDKTYGTIDDEEGKAIIKTADGNFIVAGDGSLPDTTAMKIQAMAVKISADGNEVWTRYFGGKGNDEANAITPVTDGYVLAGSSDSYSTGSKDVYVVKMDTDGKAVWSSTFGGPNMDVGYGVIPGSNGDVIVAGAKGTQDIMCSHVYLVDVDAGGKKIWEHSVDSVCSIGYALAKDRDGDFVVAGLSNADPLSGGDKATIFKFDSNGNLVKKVVLDPSGTGIVYSVINADSTFVAAGYTSSGVRIVGVMYGLDTDLNVSWTRQISATGAVSTRFMQVIRAGAGAYATAGTAGDSNNLQGIVFVRL